MLAICFMVVILLCKDGRVEMCAFVCVHVWVCVCVVLFNQLSWSHLPLSLAQGARPSALSGGLHLPVYLFLLPFTLSYQRLKVGR